MADYYDILGVTRSADEKELRQAYRRLARQHHPDVNPGDEAAAERFKSINAAYEVLSDADKRAKYDRYGDQWQHAEHFEQNAGAGGSRFAHFFRDGDTGRGSGGFTFGSAGGSFSDILDGLGRFGGFGGRNEPVRPRPAEVAVEITLEEADAGTTRRVNLPSGKRLEVKIPAGIADGSKVHIAPANEPGDEFNLAVTVLPHRRFTRDGVDLHTAVEAPLLDAILGGAVKVPTLRGEIELTLPPETQNGRRFRLAGQGMAALNDSGRRGNLFATVNVKLPANLTDEQRRLFQQLRAAESEHETNGDNGDRGDDGDTQR